MVKLYYYSILKQFKKNIAQSFVLLFVTAQFLQAIHSFAENHAHYSSTSYTYNLSYEDLTEANNLTHNVCTCLLCQQHQNIKFNIAGWRVTFLDREFSKKDEKVNYNNHILKEYLLQNSFLRGPPFVNL